MNQQSNEQKKPPAEVSEEQKARNTAVLFTVIGCFMVLGIVMVIDDAIEGQYWKLILVPLYAFGAFRCFKTALRV